MRQIYADKDTVSVLKGIYNLIGRQTFKIKITI